MTFWPQSLVDWAQVFSGVGTVAAVALSLYLAGRSGPRLVLHSYRHISLGGSEPYEVTLVAEITNVGTSSISIKNVFHTAHGAFYNFPLYSDDGKVNTNFPVRLRPGESIELLAPVLQWALVKGPWSMWRRNFWEIHSNTGTVQRFRVKRQSAWNLWKDLQAIRGGASDMKARAVEIDS